MRLDLTTILCSSIDTNVTTQGIYIPLDAEKRTSNPDFVNVIGVVTKVKEPKEAKDQFAIPGTKC